LDYYRYREGTCGVATPAAELLPVDLIGLRPAGSGLRVELANGRRIVVEAGFEVEHLKRLLAALEV
jgi:small ligand-binding sensory domain FIST